MDEERWQISKVGGRYFSKCLLNQTLSRFRFHVTMATPESHWLGGQRYLNYKSVLKGFLPSNQRNLY